MGKWKWKSLSRIQLFATPWTTHIHGILQARILEWVTIPFSGNLPNPGIEPSSHTLQADSLPAEPPGKTKNTGVDSLSLLQQIFPTQESNQGLLHCRWILYQLNYQRSLDLGKITVKSQFYHTLPPTKLFFIFEFYFSKGGPVILASEVHLNK